MGERLRRRDDDARPAGSEPDDDDRDARGGRPHRRRDRPAGRSPTATTASAACRTSSARSSSSSAPGSPAICVEDNLFPKRNSLYTGESKRELIPAEEQARRIRAGKAAQETDSFVFIARVEALIAGHGVEAACERADAYVEAGADAILIHSKDKSLGEIEGFLGDWGGVGKTPLVAVPTLFPDFTDRGALRQGLPA